MGHPPMELCVIYRSCVLSGMTGSMCVAHLLCVFKGGGCDAVCPDGQGVPGWS